MPTVHNTSRSTSTGDAISTLKYVDGEKHQNTVKILDVLNGESTFTFNVYKIAPARRSATFFCGSFCFCLKLFFRHLKNVLGA